MSNPSLEQLASNCGGVKVKAKQDFMYGCTAFTDQDLRRFAQTIVLQMVWEIVKDKEVPLETQKLIGDRLSDRFKQL